MKSSRKTRRGRGSRRRSLGEGPESLAAQIRHAESEMDAGDCVGAYEALLTSAGLKGAQMAMRQAESGEDGKLAAVVKRFAKTCLRKSRWSIFQND